VDTLVRAERPCEGGRMTATEPQGALISGQQLVEMLGLIKEADSVELKLTIPEAAQRSAIKALRMDPLEAQIRQVFFFDTPDLALQSAGVVVRARRVQRKGDDSTVKLRPVIPHELPDELRADAAFNVEVDAMPGGFVCSGTLKGTPRPGSILGHVHEGEPVRKIFSKQQRSFFAQHGPEGIALDDLHVLGPIFVLKLKWAPESFKRRLVAEVWLYPDGSRILELSTRCATHEAFEVAAETRGFLTEHGVDLGGEQQTKTRTALEFFARELAGTPPVTPAA
jgi:hypothetical protein